MPTRIPVCIADQNFPSLNQARIHYRDILHRYVPGQNVNEQDQHEVMKLMTSSGLAPPVSDKPQEIRVQQGHYGRSCFARCSAGKSAQVMSIQRAVKMCVVGMQHGADAKTEVCLQEAKA